MNGDLSANSPENGWTRHRGTNGRESVIDIDAGGGETPGSVGKNGEKGTPAPETARCERRVGKTAGRLGLSWRRCDELREFESGHRARRRKVRTTVVQPASPAFNLPPPLTSGCSLRNRGCPVTGLHGPVSRVN